MNIENISQLKKGKERFNQIDRAHDSPKDNEFKVDKDRATSPSEIE